MKTKVSPAVAVAKLKDVRSAAAKRQGWKCHYCDRPMWDLDRDQYAERHGVSAKMLWQFKCTAEHLIDRAVGGVDEPENIVAACIFCNNRRSEWGLGPADFKIVASLLESAGRWRLGQGVRKISLPKSYK
jgi:5-methylcytosine-specific restriction endonuclease McrA